MKNINLLLFSLFTSLTCLAQTPIAEIVTQNPKLRPFIAKAEKFKIQIIYTQIDRDSNGVPSFFTQTFRPDAEYFYPASLVKLPTSILALEKLKALNIPSNSIYLTTKGQSCQREVFTDTSSPTGLPSIMHYIRKMALVSDNFGFGRVWEMIGVNQLHLGLHEKGFAHTRITHRFDGGCNGVDRSDTNPGIFMSENGDTLYQIPFQQSDAQWLKPIPNSQVGRAHISGGKTITKPRDFSTMNYLPLEEVHEMLRRLIFPESISPTRRFDLRDEDREELIHYLTIPPRLGGIKIYESKEYPDQLKKYLIYGDQPKAIIGDSIQITNIVGQSYGFLIDCAYINDRANDVEFMLSAVIYVNANEIINDGVYEYKSVGLPYLGELGRTIYHWDRARRRIN